MSNKAANATWVIALSIFAGLVLSVWPVPDAAQPFWPSWLALILIYWGMALPNRVSIGIFWGCGILVDVLRGALLGEHALALAVLAFVTLKWHLRLRVFPMQQQMLAMVLLLGIYHFLLLWIRGIAGAGQPLLYTVGPIVTGTLLWPWAFFLLRGLRRRYQVS